MRRWIGLTILGLVGFLAFLNQQLLALLLDPVKKDLALSDTQIGVLNGFGIAVVYAVAAIPLGWLADRYDRRLVLGGCMIAWSLATAACGFAMSYFGYSAGAIAMAMGEAALIPIIYAMIPPIFPERERATANAIVYAIIVLAGGLSFMIGGAALGVIDGLKASGVAEGIASWRILFVAAGVLGIPIAFLLAVVPPAPVTRPKASSHEGAGFASYLRSNGMTLFLMFMALSLYGMAWLSIGLWTPAMLSRVYGLSAAMAGTYTGAAITLGTIVGIAVAWWLMRPRGSGAERPDPLRIVQAGCWIALPVIVLLPFAPDPMTFLALIGIANGAIVMATAMAPAICQNAAPNIYSSRTIALAPLVGLLPRAVTPSAIGAISDWIDDPAKGLPIAVSVVCGIVLPLSIILLRIIHKPFTALSLRNEAHDRGEVTDLR
jgi:MFS family permease